MEVVDNDDEEGSSHLGRRTRPRRPAYYFIVHIKARIIDPMNFNYSQVGYILRPSQIQFELLFLIDSCENIVLMSDRVKM